MKKLSISLILMVVIVSLGYVGLSSDEALKSFTAEDTVISKTDSEADKQVQVLDKPEFIEQRDPQFEVEERFADAQQLEQEQIGRSDRKPPPAHYDRSQRLETKLVAPVSKLPEDED